MAKTTSTKSRKKINYIYAKGRRREASARVRLYKGRGDSLVNGKPYNQYFRGEVSKALFDRPFDLTDTNTKYYVTIRVLGGGLEGQLGAALLGISRALVKAKSEFRPALKKAGLLTRDPRIRERRKVGMGGKARRKKQSPKR